MKTNFRAASDAARRYGPPPDPYKAGLERLRDYVTPPAVTPPPTGAGRFAPPDPFRAHLERLKKEPKR